MSATSSALFRQRVLLGITAIIAAIQAAISLFVPTLMAMLMGFEEEGIVLVELRATYGGFMAGMAMFLGLAVFQPHLRKGALTLLLCSSTGAAAGRIFGMLQLGAWSPVMIVLMIYEIAIAVIAAIALARPKQASGSQRAAA